MTHLNETHDPALSSWLASANDAKIGFPVQHLPFAVFRRASSKEKFRPGVALGDQIIDLAELALRQPFSGLAAEALNTCTGPTLNALMALGNSHWSALRLALSQATRRRLNWRSLAHRLLQRQRRLLPFHGCLRRCASQMRVKKPCWKTGSKVALLRRIFCLFGVRNNFTKRNSGKANEFRSLYF